LLNNLQDRRLKPSPPNRTFHRLLAFYTSLRSRRLSPAPNNFSATSSR